MNAPYKLDSIWAVISDPEKVHRVAQMSIEWMKSVKESNPAMYKEAKIEAFTTARDEMGAHALGLGSSWSGGINTATQANPPLIELLGLPKDTFSYGTILLGYPAEQFHKIPDRSPMNLTWN